MANLKNKKSNMAKKTTVTSQVQSAAPAQVGQSAVTAKETAKETAVKTEAKQETKQETKTAAVSVKKEEPAAAKAAEAKKPAEKKAAAKKPAAKKTTKRAAKKPEPVQEIFFEYGGEQILAEELVGRIKETYKNEGHRIGAIKSLRVYINPEDRKAYYVINDKADGKYVEF